jgi:hypothetical protein
VPTDTDRPSQFHRLTYSGTTLPSDVGGIAGMAASLTLSWLAGCWLSLLCCDVTNEGTRVNGGSHGTLEKMPLRAVRHMF